MYSVVSLQVVRPFFHRFGKLFCGLILGSLIQQANAQTVAFPGALGFGAYATGGRNGSVYHVTTLADSGAGSFRTGVGSGNRVIVFDVGGHITLKSAVSCKDNLTIAGQTAPGGICFDAGEISFSGRQNIICRYIRVRPGSDTASTGDDCLGMYDCTNAMFDHVSVAFGPYDNVDAVNSDAVSFQNCIDADPIGQQFGAHIESSGGWSWQYNIFANSHNRNPLAKTSETFINNIEYNNSAGYTTHTSGQHNHDIVNNYFVSGPASGGSSDFPWFQVDNNQSVYEPGNYLDSNKNGALDGGITTVYWYQGGGGGTVLSAPWSSWTAVIPTVSAALAWRYDLSAAGAFPRDDMDSLIISQMQTLGNGTTGTGAGTVGPGSGLYTSQTQTGLGNNGYGTFTGLAAIPDSDGDGMPDYWELATGSNPNVANPLTNTITGYTLLENYLNFLAAPHAVTQTSTSVTINLTQFTGGFSPSATFTLANATNGTVSLVNSTSAQFTPTANFTGLGGFNFTVHDGGDVLTVAVTVCVTPVTPPASATQFGGAIIGVSVTAAAPPDNLLWHGDGTANDWNTTTSNWLDSASASLFKNGDVVTFNDTGFNTPAIALSGTILPGAIFFNDNNNYTLAGSGALSGSASFSKTGSGTLTIATTNSGFSGSVNVSGGTLALNNGTSMGSGPVTLSDATVSLATGHTATYISSVTVPAGQTGTIASGYIANGCSGNFTGGDASSVLNLDGSQSLSGTSTSQLDGFPGTINIFPGSAIRFSANSSGHTYGSLNPNFIINGSLQPRNAGNTISLGALNGSGSLQGPQTAGTGTGNTVFNIGGNNQDAIFDGIISSNANSAGSAICVNKLGTGTQVLNGNNTFTGTDGVLAGTLLLNGSNTPSLITVFANATLGGVGTINGPVTVNNGGILSPGTNSAGTLTINGNLTGNSPIYNFSLSSSPTGANDLINMNSNGTLAMSGPQMFKFNLTDNALGAGTYNLIQGANNSTASSVTLTNNLLAPTRQSIVMFRPSAGSNPSYIQLIVSGTAASLVWSGTSGNAWDAGSTVNWLNNGNADVFYNLDTVTFNDNSADGVVSLAGLLEPASLLVNNNSLAYTFSGSGALTGSGSLTKSGDAALTMATTNSSYNGSILLAGGTLVASAPSALGNGALTIGNAATLTMPASGNFFFGGTVTIPANTSGTISSSALGNGASGNVISGNSASLLNIAGGVSFSGITSAQFDDFTGTINLQPGGTIRFSANSSGNIYGSFNPTLVINGTVQPRNAGNTVQLGAFTGSGTLAGAQSASGTGDTTYVIGGNDTDATFSGVISSNSAVVGSDVSVNKIGAGRLTLSGANTYNSGTTVSAGTLRVINTAGSATGFGDLEAFAGATLTGNGSIASATTIDNGAILAPGDPDGTLTIASSLTLNDSSLLQFTLGSSSALVAVSDDLNLTGQLTVTNGPGFGPGSYTLFTYGGALSVGNLVLASAPAGYHYGFDTNTPGVVKLTVALSAPPQFGNIVINNGRITFSGSGGTPNGTFYVLTSTNLAIPLANWSRSLTNQFDSSGNFSVTNDPATNAQIFYRLQME